MSDPKQVNVQVIMTNFIDVIHENWILIDGPIVDWISSFNGGRLQTDCDVLDPIGPSIGVSRDVTWM